MGEALRQFMRWKASYRATRGEYPARCKLTPCKWVALKADLPEYHHAKASEGDFRRMVGAPKPRNIYVAGVRIEIVSKDTPPHV